MGEGAHFYKIDGKYYITSAWYAGRMRHAAARADRLDGPYEVNQEISADETFGLATGLSRCAATAPAPQIVGHAGNPTARGRMSMHQGGIVHTPAGEWWGFSMMDANSVGRLTALSPVTWKDGWPYFGLPGNLEPHAAHLGEAEDRRAEPHRARHTRAATSSPARASRTSGSGTTCPTTAQWSLTERPGFLRLHSLPAADFWTARNTLTQRAIGPRSSADHGARRRGDEATATSPASRCSTGRTRGSACGARRTGWRSSSTIRPSTRRRASPLRATRVWLRADCDFLTEQARFSYSTDGTTLDAARTIAFTHGVPAEDVPGRALRAVPLQHGGVRGGVADFDLMRVDEPHPRGLMQPIPIGRTIALQAAGRDTPFAVDGQRRFTVVDRGLGRVALRAGNRVPLRHADVRQHEHRSRCAPVRRATARPFSGWRRCTAT